MKKAAANPTQKYLEVAEIRDGVVILGDGRMRMILLAASVNFALKSEQEQNALVGQYQNFLNSLNFPIQIVMQSRKLDLTNYLKKLTERSEVEKNELIRIQTVDYVEFIKRLISIANIMDKKFYVIIPFDPPNLQKRGLFDKIFHPGSTLTVKISEEEFKSYHEELIERVNVVMNGIAGMEVRSAPLNTQQIIELYYSVYNPEESGKERLIEEQKLESPVISREKQNSQTAKTETETDNNTENKATENKKE
ncbi:MAG: hypothetical protein M1338_05550 [Patescibacteria group bacterium]|nr:hypothetical protein [Patescibacteria group bacterium]